MEAPERASIGPGAFVLCGKGSLFELGHFEEWGKGCFHSPLCLNAELFEAFSTERAVFELTTVSLFSEPFSTVPTLDYCCNAHAFYFTSLRTCPSSSLVPSWDLRATMIAVPPSVATVRSRNMRGVTTVQKSPVRLRREMLKTFKVTCSDIVV